MKKLVPMVVVLSTSVLAFAQMQPGTTQFDIIDQDTLKEIGTVALPGANPPAGLAANTEYWEWAAAAWPDEDFYLKAGNTSPSVPASTTYGNLAFPPNATEALPASMAAGERLYRVSVCNLVEQECTRVAFLYVKETLSLQWYGDVALGTATSIVWDEQDEVLRFKSLNSVPDTGDLYRYIDNPVL